MGGVQASWATVGMFYLWVTFRVGSRHLGHSWKDCTELHDLGRNSVLLPRRAPTKPLTRPVHWPKRSLEGTSRARCQSDL